MYKFKDCDVPLKFAQLRKSKIVKAFFILGFLIDAGLANSQVPIQATTPYDGLKKTVAVDLFQATESVGGSITADGMTAMLTAAFGNVSSGRQQLVEMATPACRILPVSVAADLGPVQNLLDPAAHEDDGVGHLFDWYENGDVEVRWPGNDMVSHVTPIKCLVRAALGVGTGVLFRMELSPASLTTIRWYEDDAASLVGFNDVSYLPKR